MINDNPANIRTIAIPQNGFLKTENANNQPISFAKAISLADSSNKDDKTSVENRTKEGNSYITTA